MEEHESAAFAEKNLELLAANQAKLAEMLIEMGAVTPLTSAPTATLELNLDDDLKKAFNDVAGKDIAAQQLILQIQTDRRLSAMLQRLTVPSVTSRSEELPNAA